MLSLVIPVYKNEDNLPRLLRELEGLAARVPEPFEVVFVVDGSPDRSAVILREALPRNSSSSRATSDLSLPSRRASVTAVAICSR